MPDTPVALGIQSPQFTNFNLGDTVSKYASIQGNLAYAQNAQSEIQKRNYDLFSDQLGRAARDVMQQPDGPQKTARWNSYVDDFYNKGYINKFDHAQYYNNPSDQVLNQAIAHTQSPASYQAMTGATAGAEAAARFPYETKTYPVGGSEQTAFPAQLPGAPKGAVGYIPGGAGGGVAGNNPAPAPGTAQPPVVPGRPLSITPGPGQAPQPAAKSPDDALSNDKYYNEVPVSNLGKPVQKGPGVISPAVDPFLVQARESGQKELSEMGDTANAAAHTKAELGTMSAELNAKDANGKPLVPTSRLAELKQTVAGYLYGMTDQSQGALDGVNKLIGMDLPASEVMTKESTRMGLTFARQTEGAREAVAAIRIALGANPSLLNTVQGNQKIIDIMNRGADYDIDRSHAAQSYATKQQNEGAGVPHLLGFDNYFANAHSPSTYISKAVPYEIPKLRDGGINADELKDGVTYNLPGGKQGVWNQQRNGFAPVKQ